MIADQDFRRNLLKVEQARVLCGQLKEAQFNKLDGNVYIMSSKKSEIPMIYWSPVEGENCRVNFNSLADFQAKNSMFEKKGQMLISDIHSVFRSPELGNYELLDTHKKTMYPVSIPKEVKELLK